MDENKFWQLMDQLNWDDEGNDQLVVAPLVNTLSQLEDQEIFEFDEIMSRLLYEIDGQQWYPEGSYLSDDSFLYTRCVTIVNGKEHYYAIKNCEYGLDPDLEFESALYIPREAWARKHNKDAGDYPHITRYSFESFSNIANWPHLNS